MKTPDVIDGQFYGVPDARRRVYTLSGLSKPAYAPAFRMPVWYGGTWRHAADL